VVAVERTTVFNINQKTIGYMLMGISIILFFLVLSFTQTIMDLRLELHKTCPLPPEACPYKSSVPIESVAAFVFVITTGIFGLFLTFTAKQTERALTQQKEKFKEIAKSLQGDEKKVFDIITASDGFVFQGDLIAKTGYSKVKVSRILDRLETKNIIERRRRGMSNVVVLKQ
jgi:uncharacterized membrane protein